MTTFLLRCMSLEATPCRPLLRVERGSAVGQNQKPPISHTSFRSAPSADPRGTAHRLALIDRSPDVTPKATISLFVACSENRSGSRLA
jgi:hypothetical protein